MIQFTIVLFGALVLVLIMAVKSLLRMHWPVWFRFVVIVAFCGSVRLAFWTAFLEYMATPNTQIIGFPFPMGCFVLESTPDGFTYWTDYVVSYPLAVLFAILNIGLVASLPTIPLWILAWWVNRRAPKQPTESPVEE